MPAEIATFQDGPQTQKPPTLAERLRSVVIKLPTITRLLDPTDTINLRKLSGMLETDPKELEAFLAFGTGAPLTRQSLRQFREEDIDRLTNFQLGPILHNALKRCAILQTPEELPDQPTARRSMRKALVANQITKLEAESDQLISTREISDRYGISPGQLRRIRSNYQFPAFRYHTTVYYRIEDISAILEHKDKKLPAIGPKKEDDYHNPKEYRHGDPAEIATLLERFGRFISEKQQAILRLRSSLADGTVWSLSRVRNHFGYTTNAGVSNAEHSALAKLRKLAQQSEIS